MENLTVNQQENTLQLNKLIGMYLSRSKTMNENGDIVDDYTYTEDQRTSIINNVVDSLTSNMDAVKEEIAQRLVNAEVMLHRKVPTTDDKGSIHYTEQVIMSSALPVALMKKITDSIFEFNLNHYADR